MTLQSPISFPLRKIFRIGPVLLIPVILGWVEICNLVIPGEREDWWQIYPLLAAYFAGVIWHAALFAVETARLAYFVYAVVHLPPLWVIWGMAMIWATKFPL